MTGNEHFLFRYQGNSNILDLCIKTYFELEEFLIEVDEIHLTALWGSYGKTDFFEILS